MNKFRSRLIVLLVASLWLIPVQRVGAQGEAAQLEREMELVKFGIRGCQMLIQYPRFGRSDGTDPSEAEIEQLKGCLAAAKKRLKALREKWLKLPPGPTAETPPKDPKSPSPSNEEEAKQKKSLSELIDVLEKRLVETEADAKRAMEEMELRMKAEKASKPGFNVRTKLNGGLWETTFRAPEGDLLLNLPADMRAGDTISGTVIAKPRGQTEEERATNLAKLNRYQLMIANQTLTGPWGSFTWSWLNPTPDWLKPKTPFDQTFQPTGWALCPSQLMNCTLEPKLFALLGTTYGGDGLVPFTPVAGTPIPEVFTFPPTEPELPYRKGINIPTEGQGGHDLKVEGPFNGDMKDTEIKIGGQHVTTVAESLRSCVFKSPEQNVGLTEISVKENNVETKGSYRNIGVRLTAPKTNLMKGEKTTVAIEVRGLEGIQKDVPLKLASTGVITMVGGNVQNLVIRPSEVGPGGIYTTTRGITGQQAGAFGVTATVINSENKSTERTGNVSRAPQPFSVLRTIGTVSLTSAGQAATSPPFGNVKAGDTVKTGADGIALLERDTKEQTTRIALSHNTEVIYEPEKEKDPEKKDEEEEADDDIEVPDFSLKAGSVLNAACRRARKKGIGLKIQTNMGVTGTSGSHTSASGDPGTPGTPPHWCGGGSEDEWEASDRGKPRTSPLAQRRLVRAGAISFAGTSAVYQPDEQTTTVSYAEVFTMKSADSFRVLAIGSSAWMRDTEKKKIIVNRMQMGFITLWDKAAFRETGTGNTEKLAEEQARVALYATVNSLALDDKTTVGTLTGQNKDLADKLKKALQTAANVKMLPKVANKFAVAVEMSGAEMKKLIESLTERPMGKHAVGVTSALPEGVMGRIEELRRQFKERRPPAK